MLVLDIQGIELGPVGFMPEDPNILSEALDEFSQELVGGVVFRAFHDPINGKMYWTELNVLVKL